MVLDDPSVVVHVWSSRFRISNGYYSCQFWDYLPANLISLKLFIMCCLSTATLVASVQARAQYATAAFSPGGASDLVLNTIKSAQREIDMAAYEFTSTKIANALIDAHKRGVRVSVVVDTQENRGKGYSKIYVLARHGVEIRLNAHYAIQHNKFCVVDDTTVETGSFNYTRAAEVDNAENAVVIHDAKLAGLYHQEFTRLWQEADPLQ